VHALGPLRQHNLCAAEDVPSGGHVVAVKDPQVHCLYDRIHHRGSQEDILRQYNEQSVDDLDHSDSNSHSTAC
jgi:hypothetical protein